MEIAEIHPELQKAAKRFVSPPLHNLLFVILAKLLLKVMPVPNAGPGVAIENRKLNRAGVRIYRPEGALSGAGLLWMHGGGFIIGRAEDDQICAALARDLKLIVVSVKYRLAPEHKFPGAIDDCFEAWQWLQREAHNLGIDPARIAIAGQSAGGGLAANLVHRIFDTGGVQPAAQLLFCPMLDDRTALQSELDNIKHLMWNNRSNRKAWSWYLGRPAGSPNVPAYFAAARRENLTGLPPTWITAGDIELFYEEDRRYAARLLEAGIPCHFHVTPRAPHCFEVAVPQASLTREMHLSAYRFLCEALRLSFDSNNYSYSNQNS